MLNKVILAFKYLVYLISSGTKHSVHSPFVYDYIINVMEKARNAPQKYHGIEFLRQKMLISKAKIEMLDFGAKKKGIYEIKLSKMVQNTAKIQRKSRFRGHFGPDFDVSAQFDDVIAIFARNFRSEIFHCIVLYNGFGLIQLYFTVFWPKPTVFYNLVCECSTHFGLYTLSSDYSCTYVPRFVA